MSQASWKLTVMARDTPLSCCSWSSMSSDQQFDRNKKVIIRVQEDPCDLRKVDVCTESMLRVVGVKVKDLMFCRWTAATKVSWNGVGNSVTSTTIHVWTMYIQSIVSCQSLHYCDIKRADDPDEVREQSRYFSQRIYYRLWQQLRE